MADVQKHLAQRKHNRQFAKSIDRKYRDWQVTVIFYTALHLVTAALGSLGVDVTDHSGRNEQVKTNGALAPIRDQYMNLYRISKVTRYDADPDSWLPSDYLTVNDLVESLLRPIENGVGPLINKKLTYDTQVRRVIPPLGSDRMLKNRRQSDSTFFRLRLSKLGVSRDPRSRKRQKGRRAAIAPWRTMQINELQQQLQQKLHFS